MAQMEPVVDCSKAQTLLSDFLDVRRGEQPTSMDSPLGNPLVLQAMEKHVAHCGPCQQELHELEELGLAFSEFKLDEPETAHFAGYGRMVNERVRRMTKRTTIHPVMTANSPWRTWLSAVAASAAAAILAVVLLGPRGQTTAPAGISPEPPKAAEASHAKEASPKVAITASSEVSPLEQLADAADTIDIPTLEPRTQTLNLMTSEGSQLVTFDPSADKKTSMVRLPERSKTYVLGDPVLDVSRSTGLMGIMFRATGDGDTAGGLCVVAVKRGGPADVIGLRPDNRLLTLNGVPFSESSSTEILKFFNAVSNLGSGKSVQVDFATQNKSGEWIVKRGKAVLGKFQ